MELSWILVGVSMDISCDISRPCKTWFQVITILNSMYLDKPNKASSINTKINTIHDYCDNDSVSTPYTFSNEGVPRKNYKYFSFKPRLEKYIATQFIIIFK